MITHLRDDFRVEPICRELDLSVSACNARRRRPKSPRRRRDDHLVAEIRRVHTGSGETYGDRRTNRQLRREGATAARCTIEGLRTAWQASSAGNAAARRSPNPPPQGHPTWSTGTSVPTGRISCGSRT